MTGHLLKTVPDDMWQERRLVLRTLVKTFQPVLHMGRLAFLKYVTYAAQ